jgi:hypothetical protein
MNRGLYGQCEGNETRGTAAVLEDRMADNLIAEGEWMKRMNAAAKKGDMKLLASIRDEMKEWGMKGGVPQALAQERADSVLRQALIHLRVK